MGARKNGDGAVTIVGGRPMHRAVEAKDLPQGVEQVLTLAGLDARFRSAVAIDPVKAAAAKGIRLDSVEASLLRALPPEQIASMAERLIIPRSAGRRTFMKAVSASVVAMVTGNAFLLCSGCTGADTWEQDASPQQRWMNLAGYACYVSIPSEAAANPSGMSRPVLLAFHGEDETCLSSAQRWQAATEQYGFCLIAINWEDGAQLPDDRVELAKKLGSIVDDFEQEFPVDRTVVCVSSRGRSADMLFDAAFLDASSLQFRAVAMLGGVPPGDWTKDAEALLHGKTQLSERLYYVMGKADTDYEQAQSFASAAEARGATVKREVTSGSTSSAVLSFGTIWEWMRS